MSMTEKGTISMNLIPSSGEKISKSTSETKLPSSLLGDVISPEKQLLSIGLSLPNFDPGKKMESAPPLQFSCTNSLLLPMQNTLGTKPKKRSRSKSGSKNQKKRRKGVSSNSPDEEALDTDIFAFVESLDTNKNLDSDSSTNTIIFDDINDQASNNSLAKDEESKLSMNMCQKRTEPTPGKSVLKNIGFQDETEKHSSETAFSSYNVSPMLSLNNDEKNLNWSSTEICTNFHNTSKGKVIFTQKPSSVTVSHSQGKSFLTPLIKEEIPENPLVESKSSFSLPSNVNNKNLNPFNVKSVSPSVSSPSPILRSLITNDFTVCSPMAESYVTSKGKKKPTSNLSGAQVSEVKEHSTGSSVNSASVVVPNVCQSDKRINSQSVYASMGLDEDLCDLDEQNALKLKSKSTSKESHGSLYSTEHNTCKFPVKIENDNELSIIAGRDNEKTGLLFNSKNEALTSNDLHVSMIFEAEPQCDEEEEDDLPLSVLKNQISTDEIVPKIKEKSEELNNFITGNISDIPPSLFIKKELIEDEIVSESQAVSSKNLSVSNANYSTTEVKSSVSAAPSDFMTVKIKTEPVDDFPSHEPAKDIPTSLNCHLSQVSVNDTVLIPKMYQEDRQKSVLGPTVSSIVCQSFSVFDNSISPSFVSKPQSDNRLNVHSVSGLVSVSSLKSKNSNFSENTSDTRAAVNKESKKIGVSNKRKSSAKNTKSVTRNVEISPSVDFEADKNFLKEAQQDFRPYDDNSDLSSCLNATDTDTESNSSKKRGKRKKNCNIKIKQSVKVDENLPITLLIKRQKSDTVDENASDSFLCTSISKSVGESKSSPTGSTNETLLTEPRLIIKDITLSDVNLHSQNLVTQKNKSQKRQYKKKQVRKPKGKSISSSNMSSETVQSDNQFLNSINVPVKSNDNNSQPYSRNSLNTESTVDRKCETYVYMTFEEHSPVEEITEEDMNSVLPLKKEKDLSPPRDTTGNLSNAPSEILSVIKNIKQEKDPSLHPESVTSEEILSATSSHSNLHSSLSLQVEETLSTISSVASNSNIEDDSNVSALSNFENSTSQTKKKKRRARSNGWYKKKKSKAKSKKLPSVEMREPTNLPIMATNKVPIVIIKNLLPETSKSDRHVMEINNSVCPAPETVELPVKSKNKKLPVKSKNKKRKASHKRKKADKSNDSISNNEVILQNTGSEFCKDVDNAEISDKLKNANVGNSLLNDTSVSASCTPSEGSVTTSENPSKSDEINPPKKLGFNDNHVHSNLTNSEAVKLQSNLFPSLNVDEISQEIAAYIRNLGGSSDKSRQSASGYGIGKELNMPSKVSEPNILKAFNSRDKSIKSNRFNSFEPFAGVEIKKELDDYLPVEVPLFPANKNDKLDSSHNAAQISPSENDCVHSNKELHVQNADCNLLPGNLSCIKKENNIITSVQDKSLSHLTTAENSDRSLLDLDISTIDHQRVKITDSVSKISTCSPLQSETLKDSTQNSPSVDIDKIALLIKKEVNEGSNAKSRSSNYGIKDQIDLIQKACGVQTGKSTITSNISDSNAKAKLVCSVQSSSFDSKGKENSAEDDEIQILKIANQKNSKDVPIVDLTSDNTISDLAVKIQEVASGSKVHVNTAQVSGLHCSSTQVNAAQKKAMQSSSWNNSKHIPDELFQLNEVVKTENSSFRSRIASTPTMVSVLKEKSSLEEENKQGIINYKEASLSSEFEANLNGLESPRNKDDVLSSHFIKEKDDAVKIEIGNSLIARDKYVEDYFKHPFPPSMVLHNTKQRNRNKMYMRINSKAWNLSVEEVESRLKLSDNVLSQIGKKLGDVIRLEKYPVSFSEVECYHRILGVAPSHKLLSKCFKSPDKKVNTFTNNGFNLFPGFQQANINRLETEKQYNHMTCSLDDIFQGIAETKMMYSNNNTKNNISVYERDCPSTETRDSCDSYVSNRSASQSKDLKTFNNSNEVSNEFAQGSSLIDTKSDGRSSALSHRHLSFNETANSDITNLSIVAQTSSADQFVNSYNSNENVNTPHSQNTSNYLNTSNQEANHIVNITDTSSSCVASCDITNNYIPELRNSTPNSIETQSSSNSCQSSSANAGFKANEEPKLQSEEKPVFNIIDVPVTELRKILETAGNLCTDTVSYDEGCLWKSKATFEYNHTQSFPSVGTHSKSNNLGSKVFPPEIAPCSTFASQSDSNDYKNTAKEEARIDVSEKDSLTKNTVQEDSDNDYVDNEPICNDDYDREEDDKSSHAEEHVNEERAAPQYKSKWEKIMERKSLENKEREIVNEHLLKDCFPVSSTKKGNKSSSSSKSVFKCNEEPESSKKETSSVKKQNRDGKMNLSQKDAKLKDTNSSKSNTAKQNNKSPKTSKEKAEKNKTKTSSEKETMNKASVSKKNKASADDVSSLFVPDKPVKTSKLIKPDTSHQSNENNSKRFYGNRVTNRGTFLTESSSSEHLKKIKIPKKKTSEIPKKHINVRSEEFHSMVKSPDINIESTFRSSYKNVNKSLDSRKNSESYRSPLENTSSSASSPFIRMKQMRDRRMYDTNFQHQGRLQHHKNPFLNDPRPIQPKSLHDENMLGRKPLLSTLPSNMSPLINDECIMNRKSVLLNTPSISPLMHDESTVNRKTVLSMSPSLSSHQLSDGSTMGRNISLLSSLSSISSHPSNEESKLGKNIPNLIIQPSISPQLPAESFQPADNMDLLHKIISAIKSSKTSSVPSVNEDVLPFSDGINPWDNSESNSPAFNCSEPSTKQGMNIQPIMPGESIASVNKSFGNRPLADFFDTLNPSSTHLVSNIAHKNQFDSPDLLNSPQFSTSVSSSSHVTPQPNRKATCLVPQRLKALVGHETIDTHNVRLLMLEWSVDWLMQQQQFHDPPPISNALKKVVSTYESFEDYYNSYFPLMLLETWQRIYVSWTHLNQASPYSCQITSYSVKSQYVSVECQTVFNTAAHPKGVFPDEGSILMVKYSTKSNEYTIKILGYVTHVKTRRFNSVTDSKLFSSLRLYKDANPDVLQILSLTFMGAYNSEDIDKRQPIRIHVLCNVRPTLKQNDALLFINKSPLQRSILNPIADGLLSFTLTPRNSPLEKINDCVRDITKGILSPHPLPLLTVVRAKPESDRLNIIPMLIMKMKSTYKTKVLLCVRTVRALGDIAANICLHQSLKLVIINKRCDTNPQFQKYLLDEIAAAELSRLSEDKTNEKHHIKNDVIVKYKKQVLKECDVVLSLIRNCHDEFMGETFTETDCVSQMCCIVDEANLCTEPETLIPILHGISKLILIGDPDYPAKVLSKTASAYDYSQSFFQRAYALDLITE